MRDGLSATTLCYGGVEQGNLQQDPGSIDTRQMRLCP